MALKLIKPFLNTFKAHAGETIPDLSEWRTHLLNGVLRGIFVLWLAALAGGINNVMMEHRESSSLFENSTSLPVLTISLYLGVVALFAFITFNKRLKFNLRAGILLFILYTLGVTSLVQTSFSGDGRVFLFAFVILAAIFFDFPYSLAAFALAFLALATIGYLRVSGFLSVPVERQANANLPGAWATGALVLLILALAGMISITFLLQTLTESLTRAREALEREHRVSGVLRTLTGINQLIVREPDLQKLLAGACESLVSGRGYTFAWIGLLDPDRINFRLAASSGWEVDPNRYALRLDREGIGPQCAAIALRSRNLVRMEPALGNDICSNCPLLASRPDRVSITLPLARDENLFGALTVVHADSSAIFDEGEIVLLKGLADDISFALEKAGTDARLKVKALRQNLLAEIANLGLESPTLDILLHNVAEKLKNAFQSDDCFVVLWNESDPAPFPAAATGSMREAFLRFKPNADEIRMISAAFDRAKPFTMEDVAADPNASKRLVQLLSIHSLMGFPLVADGRRQGGVFLVYREPHRFMPDELFFGEQAAAQAALAVAKIRLNEEMRVKAAELKILYASAQDMASSLLDPPALLKKLARHMTEAFNVTSASITAINLAEGYLRVDAEFWSAEAAPAEVHSDMGRIYPAGNYATVMKYMSAGRALVLHADDAEMSAEERKQFTEYGIQSMMFVPIMAHGRLLGDAEIWESRHRREFTEEEKNLARAMAGHAASIIENVELVDALRASESRYRTLVEQASDGIFLTSPDGRYVEANQSGCAMLGYSREEILSMRMDDLIDPGELIERPLRIQELAEGKKLIVERNLRRKDGSRLPVEISATLLPKGYMQGIVRDVTERKLAEQALAESNARLEGVISTAMNAIVTVDSAQNIVIFNPAAEKIFGHSAADVLGKSIDMLIPERYRDIHRIHVMNFSATGVSNRSMGMLESLYGLRANGGEFPMEAYISQSVVNDRKFFTVILQDIAERKASEEALRQRAYELELLSSISSSLRAASNVAEMIPIIVRHAAKVVNAANASIFLLDGESGELVSSSWYDAHEDGEVLLKVETAVRHRLGKGITGCVAQTGEPRYTEDLQTDETAVILPLEADRLREIHSGLSLPLRAHKQVVGVLHVWLRKKRTFTENETRLLTAVAEMAGNAIHRASLHEQALQHANELALAYDNTLAGWARALELRDELTEGHTRRVTDLTVQLARAMNAPEEEIVQIRRGAILHDIGKMGIPDSILNKTGSLTAHEKQIMQMHPQYAYDMLSLIPFLKPALDIPYCHHEWWDGNGYPRGLKEEEIPLAARIFSVADVWDALTSDRPYRAGWTRDATLKYIKDGAGKQFDPRVVEVFLKVIEKR